MGKLYLGTQAVTPAIYSGTIPGELLDPAQVYHDTRPSDWLPMPTPENNEIYLLVEVPKPMQEKDPGVPLAFSCTTSAGQYRVELGTVTNGEFVADSTYTTLVNSNTSYGEYLYYADWTANPMDDGTHQVMAKISVVSGDIGGFTHVTTIKSGVYANKHTLEARGHCERTSRYTFGSTSSGSRSAVSMKFCSLEGPNAISSYFYEMFAGCSSLITIPALNTSSGTTFNNMFQNCYSLIAIPSLDTSSATNFLNMFNNCSSLTAIPTLDTSSGTSFLNMFNGCSSLTTIPALNTSSGTNFSGMFASCYSLTTIPALDTSSGTSFQDMFSNCSSLMYVNFVGYDFTGITNGSYRPSTFAQGGGIMRIDNKFQMSTGGFAGAVINNPQGVSSTNPFYVLVEDESTMIPLGANATVVFTTNSSVYVVVPDSMYDTYAADTRWATLHTRLKRRSEVTLPDWYTN